MGWTETLRTGFEAIRSHRLRSVLTVVGIAIGIAAVVLTVGLGQGATNQITSEITALGTNVLTVSPGSTTTSAGVRSGFGTASTLTQQDATALQSKVVAPDVLAEAPVASGEEEVTDTANSSNWTTTVNGTTPVWETVRGRSVAEGRFIDNQDVADHADVAVLGEETASELFGAADPVGQTVEIGGLPITVVGVLNEVGSSSSSSSAANQDDMVILPITTASEQILGRSTLSSILLKATSTHTLGAAYQEADAELLALHQITTSADADFSIASESSLVSTTSSVEHTLTLLLEGIAGISLLVGGIGVMNIMLVSVTERVREIGLRKALGATPALIRRQFVLEASMLGLGGGLLGAAVALVGADVLPRATGYPISISAAVGLGALAVAIAIGLIFGVYPATRAARMAPIDALRSE